jgi:hypothetical protein
VGLNLHLIPVLTVDCYSDSFHVGVEGHGLESTEHHVIETDVSAELPDRSLDVEGRGDLKILNTDVHLIVHVLIIKWLVRCYIG